MQRILITGSNRGIGLALVKEYLAHGDVQIFATCRVPGNADELQQLAQSNPITVIPLDINAEDSIVAAVDRLAQHTNSLDLLINNAGILPKQADSSDFGSLKADKVSQVVVTNSVSPLLVTQAFVQFLKQAGNPRIIMISSQMGSLTRASSSRIAYRMSKASMNMAARALSSALRADGITVITAHPGHVATDMGGAGAPVKPAQSAAGLVRVIENLQASDTGKFLNYTGEEIPW